MNEIDPASRFNADAVKNHDGGKPDDKRRAELNAIAEQVATQYRNDFMSPVMVSGVLRLVEFGILIVSGLIIYLASEEAAFVTGANIAINGGQHMQ